MWRRSPWLPGGKCENIVHTLHFKNCYLIFSFMRSDGCWFTWAEQEVIHFQPPSHLEITKRRQQVYKNIRCSQPACAEYEKKLLTCLAAILEDPTTFPLLSSTSIPSDSSLCLIKLTLQMFAVAEDRGKGSFYDLINFHMNRKRCWRQEMQSKIIKKKKEKKILYPN